jgi:hypothetical protein
MGEQQRFHMERLGFGFPRKTRAVGRMLLARLWLQVPESVIRTTYHSEIRSRAGALKRSVLPTVKQADMAEKGNPIGGAESWRPRAMHPDSPSICKGRHTLHTPWLAVSRSSALDGSLIGLVGRGRRDEGEVRRETRTWICASCATQRNATQRNATQRTA